MTALLEGLDLDDFWEDSDYARENYESERLTKTVLASVESELGYKLPASFIELMSHRNGGIPRRTSLPTTEPTSWASDHVALTGIFGVGSEKDYALCGALGSRFMIEEWGYPEIGVYFADCPSAGHDMLCMDYRKCGPSGEPTIVHVDQELDYRITFLAPDFATFVRRLVDDSAFA